jgi:ribosomal-protein-alanine N-acetyltransferase
MAVPLPIETDRLLIRLFELGDARDIADVYCDAEVMRYIPGGTLDGLGAVRERLATYAEAQAAQGFSSWAVVERESGKVVGDAGFGIFEPTGDVELGYTLARDRWGRGYATEAAGACLLAGLEHLEAPRIVAAVDAENERSLPVPGRIGMRRLGEVEAHGRPHVLFAATRR